MDALQEEQPGVIDEVLMLKKGKLALRVSFFTCVH